MKIIGKKSLVSFLKMLIDIALIFIVSVSLFYLVSLITNFKEKKFTVFNDVHIVISPPRVESFIMMSIDDVKAIISHEKKNFSPAKEDIKKFRIYEKKIKSINLILMTSVLVFLIIILIQLRIIFKNLTINKIYSRDNPRRFLYIGVIIIFMGIIKNIIYFMNNLILYKYLVLYNCSYSISLNFDFTIIFLGLLFIVLAEVFKYGVKLKAENDLTI